MPPQNPKPRILLATRNRGKLREFRSLMEHGRLRLLGLEDTGILRDCPETGITFAENARQKALEYSMESELPVLADDSGLEVFVIGGRPGIHSARYAGRAATDAERIRRLLAELAPIEGSRREARFVCALALARHGKVRIEVEGECRGLIAQEPKGRNGFGYDPIFFFPQLGKTYAELSAEEKNLHSHRARAVALLLQNAGFPDVLDDK
jgi:XTP/dITP diphosphohydrolase